MVYPRRLHVAMGAKDAFFNDYSKSAIKKLVSGWSMNNKNVCFVDHDSKIEKDCGLIIEINENQGHEFIGHGEYLR